MIFKLRVTLYFVLNIDKRSIKILTLGIVGTFPFVYKSVSRTYIMSKVKNTFGQRQRGFKLDRDGDKEDFIQNMVTGTFPPRKFPPPRTFPP